MDAKDASKIDQLMGKEKNTRKNIYIHIVVDNDIEIDIDRM